MNYRDPKLMLPHMVNECRRIRDLTLGGKKQMYTLKEACQILKLNTFDDLFARIREYNEHRSKIPSDQRAGGGTEDDLGAG